MAIQNGVVMRKFTNDACIKVVSTGPEWDQWGPCGEPIATRTLPGGKVILLNTPFCETHCAEFHASSHLDIEHSMGS